MRIVCKYCGHCRPFADMTRVPSLLREQMPDLVFVAPNTPEHDLTLVLNACPSACARSTAAGPVIVLACTHEASGLELVVNSLRQALTAFYVNLQHTENVNGFQVH